MELNNRPEVIRQLLGENHVVGQITYYWTTFASRPKNTLAVKKMAEENQFAKWQDAFEAWTGLPKTTQNGTTDTGNIRSAILEACAKYAGQNALLVVVSDLNELDSNMEDVPEPASSSKTTVATTMKRGRTVASVTAPRPKPASKLWPPVALRAPYAQSLNHQPLTRNIN